MLSVEWVNDLLILFLCISCILFTIILWRGLVLGEKKCSSSSLALTLEYYIELSQTFPVCYCLLQHRWPLIAMCIIILYVVMYIQTTLCMKDFVRHLYVWEVWESFYDMVCPNSILDSVWMTIYCSILNAIFYADPNISAKIALYKEQLFCTENQILIRS